MGSYWLLSIFSRVVKRLLNAISDSRRHHRHSNKVNDAQSSLQRDSICWALS